MRQRHDPRVIHQRGAYVRLARKDIESGPREPSGLQRVEQRRLVNQITASGVDEQGAVTHLRKPLTAYHALRLWR